MYINGKKFKTKRYSSGEFKFLKSKLNSYIKDNIVEILYMNEESIFELMLLIDYYKKNNVKVNLILTYLPYQRMDHIDRDELDTINYVANIFNRINLNSLVICEPHCKIDAFNNAKQISYIKLLKDKVFKEINFDQNTDTIYFADKGGVDRYSDISKNYVYFDKERDFDTGLIIKHKMVGKVNKGGKCLIIDDIISTGDTLVNVVEQLQQAGAGEIYIFSGHFEKNKYNKRLINNESIKKIFSTNSLIKKGNKKLKLYDIKELFYGK